MDEDVRVYGGTAITCIVIAVVNVICNLFLGLPAELNIKWIIFGGTSVAAFYFIQKNRYIQPMAILVYLVAILVNLPLTFIEEGEIGRPFVIYIAAIVVAISFLNQRQYTLRIIMFISRSSWGYFVFADSISMDC